MTLLENAEALARRAHAGQFRRDGTTLYITHPERVVSRLRAQGVTDEGILAAAWLHDVIEDGAFVWRTLEDAGIPDDVVEMVALLTKPLGTSYQNYLNRLVTNKAACRVKVADMLDNLSDSPTKAQIVKYATTPIGDDPQQVQRRHRQA